MKKIMTFLVVSMIAFAGFAADTTTVVSHQNVVIKTNPSVGQTLYPKWATFPSTAKQYKKVLMQLSFECAPGLKCGEWDYINNIIVGRTGSKNNTPLNYEIARFITPYGFYWDAAQNWQHSWYYDVTDFAMLLHDSVEVIYRHSGYESNTDRGWTVNLNFVCIEGTPVMEPIKITKLWDGSYVMGDTNNKIENALATQNITLDAQTQRARIRMMNTGHGSDSAMGCMEFCKKYRDIMWDGNNISRRVIWRNDCGSNAVYPQAGTWIYDRGGWCPGSPVQYDDVDLNSLTGGSTHSIDMDMEPYVAYKYFGNLNTTAYLIEYKAPAKANDASLEAIIAPSKEPDYKRMNPICNNPIVVIHNNGSTALTSATIEYGVEGGEMTSFDWKGNLATRQYDTVRLTNPVKWNKSSGNFVVTVKNPNGSADEDNEDNSMKTEYVAPAIFPQKIIIHFQTNKDASENSYTIYNATTNQVHHQKTGFTNEKLYLDTINLSPGNCYYFRFSDEGSSTSVTTLNKDGLSFPPFNQFEGTGSLRIKSGLNGSVLKDITASNGGPYNTDGGNFGSFYSLYFMAAFGLDVPTAIAVKPSVDVYPNPTNDVVYVDYNGLHTGGMVYITDLQGRQLYSQTLTVLAGTLPVSIGAMPAGIYIIKLVAGNETIVRKLVKR